MKITKRLIRRLIKEELSLITEEYKIPENGYDNKLYSDFMDLLKPYTKSAGDKVSKHLYFSHAINIVLSGIDLMTSPNNASASIKNIELNISKIKSNMK